LNRFLNELPTVALILTLTEAGSLLVAALARCNAQQLAGAIIFFLTGSIVAINFITDSALTPVNRRTKDAYFTTSQGQLNWTRFKKQKAAMVGA